MEARVVPALGLQFVPPQLKTRTYTMPRVELPLTVPEMLKDGTADVSTKFCTVFELIAIVGGVGV
jgi:hypothetical protein